MAIRRAAGHLAQSSILQQPRDHHLQLALHLDEAPEGTVGSLTLTQRRGLVAIEFQHQEVPGIV
jgi:hypothetical protein